MKLGSIIIATMALAALCSSLYLVGGTRAATAPPEQCDVPQSFVESDADLAGGNEGDQGSASPRY